MKRVTVLLLCAGLLAAQQPEPLINDVETAILNHDLSAAWDAATRLDDSVQAMLRASRNPEAGSLASQVLSWLPPSWESFVFVQRAFTPGEKDRRADADLFLGRLAQLRAGAVATALGGATVRSAAAAANTVAPGSSAYFFFFDGNVNPRAFGNPDLMILGRPFWRGGIGDCWFTLARPDLLLVGGSRDLAAAIVGRVLNGSSTRALPSALPEWNEVDRQAPLWGIGHFASDGHGIAIRLDADQRLEVRCLCAARPAAPSDFQVSQQRRGLWLLRSDARSGTALEYAFRMLGLGPLQ